ncbi:MAG: DUF3857 domain-containing protein [Acidobacteriota bacterium]
MTRTPAAVLSFLIIGLPPLAAAGSPRAGAADLEAGQDAVVLEEHLEIEIRSLTDARVRYLNRTRVLTPRGVERFGYAGVPYRPGVSVQRLTGTVILPSGGKIRVKKRDIMDGAAFASYELYSDSRFRGIRFDGVVPGSVVEHSYTLRLENLRFLPSPVYLQEEEGVPVRLKTLTVRVPVGFPMRLSVRGSSPDYSREEAGGTVTHRWSVRDVPALVVNPNSPPIHDLLPRITIEPKRMVWGEREIDAANWDGIARFYWDLARERMAPTAEVARKAGELTAGVQDAEEKTRLLYEFVQGKVNYVSISLDIGGWQPHPNSEVLRHLYGDCKDKATLLIAMLRAVDLRGFPVLIRSREIGTLDRDSPSLKFNHAIVAAPSPEGYLFMDPTSAFTPFGDLPWGDQGVAVLVIGEDGDGHLTQTPLFPARRNRRHLSVTGRLGPGGGLEGDVVIDSWGQRRAELAPLLWEKSTHREDFLAWFTSTLAPGARMTDQEIRPPSQPDDPIRIVSRFTIPAYVTRAGRLEIVSPHLSRFRDLTSLATYSSRRHPFFFGYPFTDTVESRLVLPPGRTLKKVPEDSSIEGPGLKASTVYELKREGGRNVLVVRRAVEVARREIPVKEYAALRDFISALAEEEARGVALKPDY